MKRKIDQFEKSRRNKLTRACLVYARIRAEQWLGYGAWHECDESCHHEETCRSCKFYRYDVEDEFYSITPDTCIIEDAIEAGMSVSDAHRYAREHVKGGYDE